jgi:hypothetical protein
MRKLLALLLLVAVVTSAFAFANSFNINALPEQEGLQNISSGSAAVDRCVADLGVRVVGGDYNQKISDFEVSEVRLTANSGSCAGDDIKVTLTRFEGEPVTVDGYRLDGGGNAIIDFSTLDIAVKSVKDVHVLIQTNNTPLSISP